jgi:hypothetical protein
VNGIYLYCVARAEKQPSVLRAPQGLPGATLPEALRVAGPLWLLVAEVPLETYGAGHLEARLGDLEWVGEIAMAHEAVVEHFAAKAGLVVIPMKLFTMFSSRERAVSEISRRRASIEEAARRIAGAEEWGIRVMRSAAAAPGTVGRTAKAGSGAAFLAAKKQARDAAREAKLAAAESALDAYERLAAFAREARRRSDTPASAAAPPLLDAAFLVPAARRTQFKAAARREAERCAKAGAELTVSGPWPAYNFVEHVESSRR